MRVSILTKHMKRNWANPAIHWTARSAGVYIPKVTVAPPVMLAIDRNPDEHVRQKN